MKPPTYGGIWNMANYNGSLYVYGSIKTTSSQQKWPYFDPKYILNIMSNQYYGQLQGKLILWLSSRTFRVKINKLRHIQSQMNSLRYLIWTYMFLFSYFYTFI